MNQRTAPPVPSRATHLLAIATVVVALPLVLLGAEVTTKGVGMVDPVAVRSPWFFAVEWMNDHGLGWLIEHGHRQVGWIVGVLAIATAVVAFCLDGRGWVKALSAAALMAIIVQGLLGIFRIQLHSLFGNTTALIHGAFAPIVLALLVTLTVATSKGWSATAAKNDGGRLIRDDFSSAITASPSWSAAIIPNENHHSLRVWCLAAAIACYTQVVLGGLIRHKDLLAAGRLHLLGAFVVFAFLWVVIKYARETDYDSFKTLSRVIMALLTIQVLLGVEGWMAWMKRHFAPQTAIEESAAMQLVRSAHYVVGAFLFATTVALTVKAFWAPARLEAAR